MRLRRRIDARHGRVGRRIRQRRHGQDFPGVHVHDDSAGRPRAELLAAGFDFVRKGILHTHIERQRDAGADVAAAQGLIEAQFQTVDAVAIRVRRAKNLYRRCSFGA